MNTILKTARKYKYFVNKFAALRNIKKQSPHVLIQIVRKLANNNIDKAKQIIKELNSIIEQDVIELENLKDNDSDWLISQIINELNRTTNKLDKLDKLNRTRDDLETIIRDTYFEFTYGQTNVPMPINVLRDVLPSIDPEQLDDTLISMISKPGVILYPEDNPQAKTTEMERGALNINGAIKHYIKLER